MGKIKITDHPIEIQDLIRHLYEDQSMRNAYSYRTLENQDDVSTALNWGKTPQGYNFWQHIYYGRYDEAKNYDCYPLPKDSTTNDYQIF